MTDPNTATPSVEPVAHEDSPVAANIVDIEAIVERLAQWRKHLANGDHRDNIPALVDIEAIIGATPKAPKDDTVVIPAVR